MERSYWNNLTRTEKNFYIIGLWFCIGELIQKLCFLINRDKLGSMFYLVTNVYIKERIDVLNNVYPGWQFFYAWWNIWFYGLILILVVINVKYSRRNNSII